MKNLDKNTNAGGFLVVGDDLSLKQIIQALFPERNVQMSRPETVEVVLNKYSDTTIVVLEHEKMHPGIWEELGKKFPELALLIICQKNETHEALELIGRKEAFSLLERPFSPGEMKKAINHANEYMAVRHEKKHFQNRFEDVTKTEGGTLGEHLEDLERKNKELESKNHFKDEMMLVAAHDLRSPLSVIVGYANVLLESEKNLSAQGEKLLSRVKGSGLRLMDMVNNLLNLGALEAGEISLEITPVHAKEVLDGAVEAVGGMLEEKGISLEMKLPLEETPFPMDGGKIIQVLQNLLSNAAKFTPEGGKVIVSVEQTPESLTIKVSDSGSGLTPEQQAKVFQKFIRFQQNKKFPGSGLGLAIAKSMVELHGGIIKVESGFPPLMGACFSFELPAKKPAN